VRTYLNLRRLLWSTTSSSYTFTTMTFDLVATDDPYLDVDLQETNANEFWVLGCGLETVHAFTTTFSSSTSTFSSAIGGSETGTDVDGEDCAFVHGSSAHTAVVAGSDGSTHAYDVSRSGSDLVFSEISASSWEAYDLAGAGSHDREDLLVFPEIAHGVTLLDMSRPSTPAYDVLMTDVRYYDADATYFDGDGDGSDEVYLWGAVEDQDDDGLNDLLLAYGDPAGTLTEAVFPLHDGVETFSATRAALWVDGDRIVLVGAGDDTLLWIFLGWP
jgi:hypothetical protein